ncbi:MAG: hypothetical protein IIB08_02310 [Bacteroidetes bacterium]|nr:hypothetical protein [Bacteroidota bacterium]
MKRFVIILFFFVLLSNSFSQDNPPFICGFDGLSGSGGLFKPSMNDPGEYIRSLIVFVQFDEDQTQNSSWPLNEMPTWANNYMDSSPSSSYSFRSLSDFWNEMSIGKFEKL